jgi:hypothetical protein
MHVRNSGIAILALSAIATAQSARIVPTHNHAGPGSGSFGFAVLAPGDLDNDGLPDFVVANLGGTTTANVVTAFSAANGTTPIWTTPTLAACPLGTAQGFGCALATVPDMTGDGISEIAVGADFASATGACSAAGQGAVMIFDGSNGTGIVTISAPTPTTNEHFGNRLCALPDLTGDGIPEIAIGNSPNLSTASRGMYIFDGRTLTSLLFTAYPVPTGGLIGTAMTLGPDMDLNGVPDLLLATSSGVVGIAFLGSSPASATIGTFGGGTGASARFGESVCTANVDHGGNIPGFLFPDIAVGDPGFSVAGGPTNAGAIQFFDAVTLGGSPHFTISGVMTNEGLGRSLCSSFDIDGDGAMDLLAASSFLVGGLPTESIAVFSGLSTTRLWNVTVPGTGSTLFPTAWKDINGDSFSEFLITDGIGTVAAMFGGPKAQVVLDEVSCGTVPLSLTMSITAPASAVADNLPALGDTLSLFLTSVKSTDFWIMGVSTEGNHLPSATLGGCPETASLSSPALQTWGLAAPPNPNGATFPVLTGFVIPANPALLGMRVAYQGLTVTQSTFTPEGADGFVFQLGW